MSGLRCKVDDLAEVVRGDSLNRGRLCIIAQPAGSDDDGPEWVIQPLQPMFAVRGGKRNGYAPQDLVRSMERMAFPDSWLRPIRDPLPPGAATTDDTAPCELDPTERNALTT